MTKAFEAIVIGASAGALEALTPILAPLPVNYPLPLGVVVHLPADNKKTFIGILQGKCGILVKEAEDKEPIDAGKVYFAPPNYHLQVEANRCFSLSNEEAILFSRPSIDVLFETAADVYGEKLLGIILTGGNDDGARGLKAVMQAGGTAIVQEPASAFVSIMPKAALEHCPEAKVMSLTEIAHYLLKVPEL